MTSPYERERDPAGQELAAIMPRYQLSEKDVVALTSYLKTLSAELSPGVDDQRNPFRDGDV